VNIELILSALVAAGLVFWLRNILGTRHGDEREDAARLRDMLGGDQGEDGFEGAEDNRSSELPRNVSIAGESVQAGLQEIARLDPSFSLPKFTMGAQDAFAMIVEGFAAGDRELLQDLLEPQVYAAFESAIAAREAREEKMETQIHAVRRADIMDVKIEEGRAFVTIRFIADETAVVSDKDGIVLSGHPERVTEMNDIWTFSKPLRGNDPRWFLHQTRDGDVTEDQKTPILDSK
jgi:predicted lipid-binding transport protein (Tim44 family)